MEQISANAEPLTWKVHPFKDRPLAGVMALALVTGFAWMTTVWMESLFWGVIAVVLLLVPSRSFFLPNEYRVDDQGVSALQGMGKKFLPWNRIRRFQHHKHYGLISSRSQPGILDNLRGIPLLFSQPEQQITVIRQRLRNFREERLAISSASDADSAPVSSQREEQTCGNG